MEKETWSNIKKPQIIMTMTLLVLLLVLVDSSAFPLLSAPRALPGFLVCLGEVAMCVHVGCCMYMFMRETEDLDLVNSHDKIKQVMINIKQSIFQHFLEQF